MKLIYMDFIAKGIILVGLLLKVIDDYYDMHLYSKVIAKTAETLLMVLTIYLFTQDRAFLLMTLICCVFIWFAEGQMQDNEGNHVEFYYLLNIVTFGFFFYYLYHGGFKSIFNNITALEIYRLVIFALFIYYENDLISEDYSKRKLLIRLCITLFAVGYTKFEEHIEEKTIIIRDIYYLAIGYMGMSTVNIAYKLLTE